MNTIIGIQRVLGGWRVEALAQDGTRLVVTHLGSRREAVQAALRAEAEPA